MEAKELTRIPIGDWELIDSRAALWPSEELLMMSITCKIQSKEF